MTCSNQENSYLNYMIRYFTPVRLCSIWKKPELWLALIEFYGLIKYTAILRSNKKNCQDNFSSITRIFNYIFQILPFYIYFSGNLKFTLVMLQVAVLQIFTQMYHI